MADRRPTAPRQRLAILTLAVLAAGCTRAPDPERELARQVRQAIDLIEAHRDAEFLQRCMKPSDYARYFPPLDAAAKAERFRSLAADKLLVRLRQAAGQKPTWNAERTEARFALQPEMVWSREGGRWRLEN